MIGCGYLGAVHAACMASVGHEVIGIDVDPGKVEALSCGEPPFYEPGLGDLLGEVLPTGRLRFTTDMKESRGSAAHFVCVGTPQVKGELAADLTHVNAAVAALLPHLQPGNIVVGKSTVPVGTAERLAQLVDEAQPEASLV